MSDPKLDPKLGRQALAPLPEAFARRGGEAVARDLLGRLLVREAPGEERQVLRLVEVEAYLGEGDAASHARSGPTTERSRRLYRPGGHAYVYLIYGMHHCLNLTTGTAEDGSAVLLRGAEVLAGEETLAARRGLGDKRRPAGSLAGGPGKLCQALGLDLAFDGHPLWRPELALGGDGPRVWLTEGEPVSDAEVARGPRIGVDYAGEAAAWPLRFAIAGHREMSRPRLG